MKYAKMDRDTYGVDDNMCACEVEADSSNGRDDKYPMFGVLGEFLDDLIAFLHGGFTPDSQCFDTIQL